VPHLSTGKSFQLPTSFVNFVTSTDSKCIEFRRQVLKPPSLKDSSNCSFFPLNLAGFQEAGRRDSLAVSFSIHDALLCYDENIRFEDISWVGFACQKEGNRLEEKARQFGGRSETYEFTHSQNY
jgi:hypothetical protein